MRLFLIRHPRPAVDPDICYGSSDIAVAHKEMTTASARLLPQLPKGVPVFSSPLRRCAAFAETIAAALGSSFPQCDARLMEMDFGAWEMQRWDDIPRAEVDAWAADLAGFRPGGGETVREVAQRVLDFRAELLNARLPQALVVAHAGTIRLLLAARDSQAAEAVALSAAGAAHGIAYGELILIEA
ncbi:alpha-ribazole phosphatase [Noviherbaspirillum humi]|uniref:Alpha-ribazole phosphatase n=1 Tax=Noviherbaspirillum humi TaxID=1688639 RepID=A0A239GT25_9BURK|nr:histidine phosphatase family protein [Noviherbaspirillum humi]SNS71224.1 alpha-ribazole phosphatase [Noviherbaspirillum humi]